MALSEVVAALQDENPKNEIQALPFESAAHMFVSTRNGLLNYALIDEDSPKMVSEFDRTGVLRYPKQMCTEARFQLYKRELRKEPRFTCD